MVWTMQRYNVTPENKHNDYMETMYTVKPALSGHSKRRPKLIFKTDYHLMHAKKIEWPLKTGFTQNVYEDKVPDPK